MEQIVNKLQVNRGLTACLVPGHAFYAKGLQGQLGDDILLSSQKRRAVIFPRINEFSCQAE